MTQKEILAIAVEIKKLVSPDKTAFEIWKERLSVFAYVASIVIGIFALWSLDRQYQQDEMIKAYFSGQQSKYAQMIGVLEGQGHRDLAEVLKILKQENEDNFYRNIKFEQKENK